MTEYATGLRIKGGKAHVWKLITDSIYQTYVCEKCKQSATVSHINHLVEFGCGDPPYGKVRRNES